MIMKKIINLKDKILEVSGLNKSDKVELRSPESSIVEFLFRAAKYGNERKVMEILSFPGNRDLINYQGANQKTAIMEAASLGQLKIVEALLKFKPNLELVDSYGNTALLASLKLEVMHRNTKAIVQTLLKHKLNPDQKNVFGHNAFTLLLSLYERSAKSEQAIYIEDFLEKDTLSILESLSSYSSQNPIPIIKIN